MIKSSHRSDHVSIERAFNRIVATILPSQGSPGADATAYRGWPPVGRDAVEQRGSEHDGEEDAGADAPAPSDTKVFCQLDGFDKQRNF